MLIRYCPVCDNPCSESAATCPKCGHPLAAQFAPQPDGTGESRSRADVKEITTPTTADRTGGFVTGLVFAPLICAVGLGLTLTGIGACFGVPLILIGPALPFIMMNSRTGSCPLCQTEIQVQSSDSGTKYPGCKRRLVLRNKMLVYCVPPVEDIRSGK